MKRNIRKLIFNMILTIVIVIASAFTVLPKEAEVRLKADSFEVFPPQGAYSKLNQIKLDGYIPIGIYGYSYGKPDQYNYYVGNDGTLNIVIADLVSSSNREIRSIKVYTYSSTYQYKSQKQISVGSSSIWGGLYNAPDGNFYLALGTANNEQDDNKTVVEIRKYDKSWNLLGTAKIKGGATNSFKGISIPFHMGNCSMSLAGSNLIVHMARLMYTQSDGIKHQGNISFTINTNTMAVAEYPNMPYCSHSFYQLVNYKNGDVLFLDLGDGYPRAILLTINKSGNEAKLWQFMGEVGNNYIGTKVTGFETSSNGILVVGNSVPHNNAVQGVTGYLSGLSQNIYVIARNLSTGVQSFKWITDLNPKADTYVDEPRIIKLNDDRFILLYTVYHESVEDYVPMAPVLHYKLLNATGDIVASKEFEGVKFSGSSVPINDNNHLKWIEFSGDYNKEIAYLFLLDISDPKDPNFEMPTWLAESISLSRTSITLSQNESIVLKVGISPSYTTNKDVEWKSSDTSVATVDNDGKVTANAPGTAIITVTTKDGSEKTAECKVTVTPPIDEIQTLPKLYLVKGKTATLPIAGQPYNAAINIVTWTSSNPKKVSVNKNGKVKGLKTGKATVTVTTQNGDKTAICEVYVVKRAKLLKKLTLVLGKDVTMLQGTTLQVLLELKPKKATGIIPKYKSSDVTVAVIDKTGVITALKNGQTTITVTIGKKKKKFILTVE